jgi:Tol biopolymer transport system component
MPGEVNAVKNYSRKDGLGTQSRLALMFLVAVLLAELAPSTSASASTTASQPELVVASGKQIHFINSSTGAVVRTVSTRFRIEQVSWSPNRARVAWVAATTPDDCDFEECWELFVADGDGSERRRLTRDRAKDGYIDWSPDSSHIAFQRDEPETTDSGEPQHDIYSIATDGSDLIRLTSDGTATQPDWSPDGSEIAYGHDRGEPQGAIWVVNADGSDPRQVSHPSAFTLDLAPAWSPDGSQILFQRLGAGLVDLYVTDPSGSVDKPLTTGAAVESGFSWSPNGAKITYEVVSQRDADTWAQKVFSMGADGSDVTALSRNIAYGDYIYGPAPVYPTWSLDSSAVAYFHNYDSRSDVWKAGATGKPRVRLTYSPRHGLVMAWGTDSKGY